MERLTFFIGILAFCGSLLFAGLETGYTDIASASQAIHTTNIAHVKHEPLTLRWEADQKLSWSDFMAEPDAGSKLAAELVCGIETEMITEVSGSGTGEMDFTARAIAFPLESWNKSSTDYLLAHEQLHFDIAELHARKLRKKVADHQFKSSSIESKLSAMINEALDKYNKEQREYDRETNHSINQEVQAVWASKVATELAGLEAYAVHSVNSAIVP